jgi:hypothetical protein
MPALPWSNIHLDILMGRDVLLQPADIFEGTSCVFSVCYCAKLKPFPLP